MKKIAIVAVMLTALICTMPAWGQGRPGFGGPGRMGGPMMSCPAMATMPMRVDMVNRMATSLKLTKVQSAKLKNIAASNEKTVRSLQSVAEKATRALHSAMMAQSYNAKNVKALAAKAENAEAKIVAANIDSWSKMRSVLTANQNKKLQSVMSIRRPAGPPPAQGAFPPFRGRAK